MKNNVLVIGNGFDLAHGLKTSYNNFWDCAREYLNKDINELEKDYEIEFARLAKENGFIRYFLEYTNAVPGWVDLERLIRSIINEFEVFIEDSNHYIWEIFFCSNRCTRNMSKIF